MRTLSGLGMILMLVACAGCQSGEVRLFKTREMAETVMVPKLDPDKFKAKEKEIKLTLNISLGEGFLYSNDREVTVFKKAQSRWDSSREAWQARYLLMVNEVNSGHLTYDEYQAWERRLNFAFENMEKVKKDLMPLQTELVKVLAERAQQDLTNELARRKHEAQVVSVLKPINEKLASLERTTSDLAR